MPMFVLKQDVYGGRGQIQRTALPVWTFSSLSIEFLENGERNVIANFK